jgi:hypothetical protein
MRKLSPPCLILLSALASWASAKDVVPIPDVAPGKSARVTPTAYASCPEPGSVAGVRGCLKRKCGRCANIPFQGYMHSPCDALPRPTCAPLFDPTWGYHQTVWRYTPDCLPIAMPIPPGRSAAPVEVEPPPAVPGLEEPLSRKPAKGTVIPAAAQKRAKPATKR